jgi:hypothetical protein
MKGVWAFLKTREWSVALVPPFEPEPDLIFLTKPWASVLHIVVLLFLDLIVPCVCITDCVRYLWVPRR